MTTVITYILIAIHNHFDIQTPTVAWWHDGQQRQRWWHRPHERSQKGKATCASPSVDLQHRGSGISCPWCGTSPGHWSIRDDPWYKLQCYALVWQKLAKNTFNTQHSPNYFRPHRQLNCHPYQEQGSTNCRAEEEETERGNEGGGSFRGVVKKSGYFTVRLLFVK